ncbi:MAG: bifunctional nuclease family protein, partial [Candidatus Sericytochromatia bacterium]|nr:bifunctional nuclease family protein [Candidatus Sericytochromatia bacterium]
MVVMKVSGIVLDPQSRTPILVLRDMEDRRALLIWIGPPEANSIMLVLENIKLSRPATHDLMTNMIKSLKVELKSVTIHDMKESTFFAQLNLSNNNREVLVDSRPSDAVALALRADVPIYVSEQVMFSSSIPIDQSKDELEAEQFKTFIDSIKPSDFFKG